MHLITTLQDETAILSLFYSLCYAGFDFFLIVLWYFQQFQAVIVAKWKLFIIQYHLDRF